MPGTDRVVIVGGGIWGLSTAYHLAQAGVRPLVLERNRQLADETTPQAAGLVGQIRASQVMTRAIQYALELARAFSDSGHDCGFRPVGSLLVALADDRLAAFNEQARRAQAHGVLAEAVDAARMKQLCPLLETSSLKGGLYIPGDGYIDPRAFALCYAEEARRLGAEIRLAAAVRKIAITAGRVVGVETDDEIIPADRVVVAAGPWVIGLAERLGIRLAAVPIRHQRARTGPIEGIPPHHPVVRFPDLSCYLRPEGDGYSYGFFDPNPTCIELKLRPDNFRTRDIDPPATILAEARQRLAPFVPVLESAPVEILFRGMTTFAPDGQYLVGPPSGVEGLYLATGCAALGIAGSAAMGRWLARMVVGHSPEEDIADFALGRFGEQSENAEWVREQSIRIAGNYYAIERIADRE